MQAEGSRLQERILGGGGYLSTAGLDGSHRFDPPVISDELACRGGGGREAAHNAAISNHARAVFIFRASIGKCATADCCIQKPCFLLVSYPFFVRSTQIHKVFFFFTAGESHFG